MPFSLRPSDISLTYCKQVTLYRRAPMRGQNKHACAQEGRKRSEHWSGNLMSSNWVKENFLMICVEKLWKGRCFCVKYFSQTTLLPERPAQFHFYLHRGGYISPTVSSLMWYYLYIFILGNLPVYSGNAAAPPPGSWRQSSPPRTLHHWTRVNKVGTKFTLTRM